jgi:pyrimidine deaminase RibD-like protein
MKHNSRLRFSDIHFMRLALEFARRGYGTTSPNPKLP